MLLTDSNILLEVLLRRTRYREARALLSQPPSHLLITDFALNSVCVHIGRRGTEYFRALHTIVIGRIEVLRLDPLDVIDIVSANMFGHSLDFDDAYQYTAAELHNLIIVSFDHHFDHTPRGRRTPAQILNAT